MLKMVVVRGPQQRINETRIKTKYVHELFPLAGLFLCDEEFHRHVKPKSPLHDVERAFIVFNERGRKNRVDEN